jgi:hypothetical protein
MNSRLQMVKHILYVTYIASCYMKKIYMYMKVPKSKNECAVKEEIKVFTVLVC